VKTISLKKVSAVAVASLGFGLLSVVPAQAAQTTAATFTSAVTNSTNTGATTAPIPKGTAMTANLTLSTTTTRTVTGDTAAMTYTITDPNSADITSTCTFAAGSTFSATTVTAISTPTAAGLFNVTMGTGAGLSGYVLGTVSCPSTMGGTYTITPTGTVADNTTPAAITPTLTAVTYVVSGINVSQGTTLGVTGAAKTANQAQVTVTFPTNASATPTYKFVSSGVGAITGATAVNASSTANISGVATDFSAGTTMVRIGDSVLTTMKLTLTNPATAGVQTITVTTVDAVSGLSTALYSTTVTWAAIAALSPGASIVRIAAAGATTAASQGAVASGIGTGYSTTADAIPYVAGKAIGTNVAQIQVLLLNSDGTAATQGHTVTASVSGSGFVLTNVSSGAANGTARSESEALTAGSANVAWIHISGDGTAGTGTIEISVTDVVSGVKTALPSKTVTFNDSVKALAVTTTNFTIGKAGSTTGGASVSRAATTEIGSSTNTAYGVTTSGVTTPAFIVKATDSGARATTTTSVPTISSSDATVVTGGTCVLDDGQNADYSSAAPSAGGTNSVGVYNCSFTTAANAVSGGKATLTISVADPASTTGGKISTTLAVTVGGSISTETVTFDKTAYAAGEAMVITRTAKDSAGNPVADGSTAGAVSFNKAVGGTAPAAGIYIGGVSASSTTVAKAKVFAPSIAGALTASMTGGDAAATVRTASSTVTDANAGLLTQIDALNAKIVALNALIAKIMKKLGVK
jgi:hypothetical protein